MRLIDADEVQKELIDAIDWLREEDYETYSAIGDNIVFVLSNQPTAYDVDKVIQQLKRQYGIVNSRSIDYAEGLKDAYERAIDIVRLGINKEGDEG